MRRVHFEPMTPSRYEAYRLIPVPQHASELQRASGISENEARRQAERCFQDLLPLGLNTENQFFRQVVDADTGQEIGILWYAIRGEVPQQRAFVCDITMDAEMRGQGYGRATMKALEEEVKARGLSRIGLHVFGHNSTARALYESLGYLPTNIVMQKDLA